MLSLQMSQPQGHDKKILIVDDYDPMRRLISDALSQSGPYLVSEAQNGREALDQCSRCAFDLVISDVMMPGMGGMELLNHLAHVSPETSVIMITAHPAVELTVSAMKKGAVDFIKKPFNIDHLLAKVQICLHERALFSGRQGQGEKAALELKDKSRELSVQSYIHEAFQQVETDQEHVFKKIVDLAMNLVDSRDGALLTYVAEDGHFHPELIRGSHRRSYVDKTLPA
jgi:DNA-binding NtrC family response regulator